jgi:hypothetical protein
MQLKFFGRNRRKDNYDIEKPEVTYYAKYIEVLRSNKSNPVDEGAYVNIYEGRIGVELRKSKFKIEIPYGQIFDIQKVDAGNKVDLERVIRLGGIVDLLWKRHHIITIIKYTDETYENQTIALDFEINTEYAQPIIEKKCVIFTANQRLQWRRWIQ